MKSSNIFMVFCLLFLLVLIGSEQFTNDLGAVVHRFMVAANGIFIGIMFANSR